MFFKPGLKTVNEEEELKDFFEGEGRKKKKEKDIEIELGNTEKSG